MKIRQNIVAFIVVVISLSAIAQSPTYKVQGGRRVVDIDSTAIRRDSTDSLKVADTLLKTTADSVTKTAKKHFDLLRDTLSPGAALGLSLVPGMGQIYNRQWWKVPIFYTLMGGGVAGGVIYGNLSAQTKIKWQNSVNAGADVSVTNSLRKKMQRESDLSAAMYVVAGLTYFYSVADATFNYRGRMNHIRKATTLAALFPGAGFIYTKTYWRIPIYYGGFAVLGSVVDYNNRNYVRYKTAYDLVVAADPNNPDEFNGRYSADLLKNVRDAYRRDRDFGIIALVAVYLLSVVDTYVIATLKNWDVSDDLSVTVEPAFFDKRLGESGGALPSGAGMSLKLKF